ncbi:hypothetical protein PITC_022000 [Penicillium italicum]|uniref:Uncharacterized protein n=1 Tax=Penicillium italicum TaxID=40296 RepID=A0A0A2L245_PENIT|nr:hypothetical protein PITC_022000 [Penicillium italicum]
MASDMRKYRLWYVPLDRSIPQKRQRRYYDKFGGYQVVRANYNFKGDWYCKHEYAMYPGAESYHYVNGTGWFYSMNPDGSEEKLHVKKRKAWYGPPDSDDWEDWSDEVPWDKLAAIPDLCVARTSRPGPRIWMEIERQEREQAAIEAAERADQEYYQDAMNAQERDDSDWRQDCEGGELSGNKDVLPAVEPRTTSDTSIKSEGDISGGGSSTGETSQDELPASPKEAPDEPESDATDDPCIDKMTREEPQKGKALRKETKPIECRTVTEPVLATGESETVGSKTPEDENEAAKHKARHGEIEKSKKEGKEHKKQKKQKKEEKTESKQVEEQELHENLEEMKLRNKKLKKKLKKLKKQRKLETKLKETGQEIPADLPNRKRKADDEDEVVTTSTKAKKKRHHTAEESGVAIGVEVPC